MQPTTQLTNVPTLDNVPAVEIKPMKGGEFDQDVQRFESILLQEDFQKAELIDLYDPLDETNPLNQLGDVCLEAMGQMKETMDMRLDSFEQIMNSPKEDITVEELLKVQYQMMAYGVEGQFVSVVGSKVDTGVQTLLKNQ